MSDSSQPVPNEQAAEQAKITEDSMREVLTKLLDNAGKLSDMDTQLGLKIRDFGLMAKEPGQFDQNAVQVAIAAVAQDFERATGGQLDLSPTERAEVTRLATPKTGPGSPDTLSGRQTDGLPEPATSTQPPPDPVRDVLTRLVANLDQLPEPASPLRAKIRELDRDARDPVRFNQSSVRHDVAYAAQDFEKVMGRQLDLAPAQRAAVTRLAGSAPGLENERMLALLRSTAQIEDRGLVREIRRNGAEFGQQSDQNTKDVQSRINVLENKVRQAPRAGDPAPDARAGDEAAKTGQAGTNQPGHGATGGARGDQSPRSDPDPRREFYGANNQGPPPVQTAVLRGGILDTVAAALRGNAQPGNAPWDPQATPFGARVTAFQAKVDARDQDRLMGRVEASARAAVEALDGFRNTEGAAVMSRVQAAARAAPGGMAEVLSGMREGGSFNDLRRAFNTALNDDKGFAQAYDKAAAALARYGDGREKVEQIIARRPDAANLTAKFEQLDGQIGERASNIPSRNEGKNMLDDISKTVIEILQTVADTLRAMVSRSPGAGAGPSASPAA